MQITSHDNGIVMLDWGEGTLGTVDGSFTVVAREGPGMVIYGSAGVISSVRPGRPSASTSAPGARLPPRLERDRSPGGRRRHRRRRRRRPAARGPERDPNAPAEDVAHWAECVAQGKRPVLSAEHARHVVEIMEKASVASRSGQAQDLTTTF